MTKKKDDSDNKNQNDKLEEETDLDNLTQNDLFSEAISTLVQKNFSNVFGDRNVKPIHRKLIDEGNKVNQGNLESVEKILIVQAHTLNVMFNNLAYRASRNDGVDLFESLMRLAFKAQSQCRTTLETLAKIKNPPQVAFVKQANIGHNQQVNNNVSPDPISRMEEIKNQQTQLLEEQDGEQLDIGTQRQAINTDKKLEAVGKVHRATNT